MLLLLLSRRSDRWIIIDRGSALSLWQVNTGMLRLYEGEVLGKLPVIQHFLFGSLFPCTWTPSAPPPDASSPSTVEGKDARSTQHPGVETAAPWARKPAAAAQAQHLPAECCRAPWASIDG